MRVQEADTRRWNGREWVDYYQDTASCVEHEEPLTWREIRAVMVWCALVGAAIGLLLVGVFTA